MRSWSLKVQVGIYAALLTMAALVAGVGVMMGTLYYYQLSRLDQDLQGDARELVWDLGNFRDAPKDPNVPLSPDLIPVDMRDFYLMVEGTDGRIVYQSANLKGVRLTGEIGTTRTIELAGVPVRVGAWRVDPYVVRVGARLNVIWRFLKDLGVGFATALPAMGLVVFFGGLWLGRRAVAPVAELSAAAERIRAENPAERLPIPVAQDEIASLTRVLNRSFDRLQTSYAMAARFSADASHQLKTPLTILRAGLDHLSRDTEMNESQVAEVARLRQQTRRITSMIDDLLLLAQADAGRMQLEVEDLDLKTRIQAASDDLQVLVSGKKISVAEDLADCLPIRGDRRLLAMAFQNLMENAAKYTPAGGEIRIVGKIESSAVVVTVANTGPGISEEDRDHIFERFRRGTGTGENVRGHGLGLSIARELVRAHGGELRLNVTHSGLTEFEVRLPVAGGWSV